MHVVMTETVVGAVGDRPIVVERGEHLLHMLKYRFFTDYVEESFLLPRKRCVGQVFGGC